MKIAEAKRRTSTKWRTHNITWDEMVKRLRQPIKTPETVAEYRRMSYEEKGKAKEAAGGFVGGALADGQRKTDHVVSRSFITLDADHADPDCWENALTLCGDWTMCAYTTHSHTAESPRYRFVLPTDRDMTPEEYPAVARMVADYIGIDQMDPTTYEVARIMYFPTVCRDGDYQFRENSGVFVPVDDILAEYGDNDAWKDCSLWPSGKSETEIRIRNAKVAGEPTEKPGIIGLFCRTYDVPSAIAEFIPEVYESAGDDRYTYVNGSTYGGAIVYNDGSFLYSNHATDPCNGLSVNAFDLVRIHKYGDLDTMSSEDTAVSKLPSYKAMSDWLITLPEIKAQLVAERTADMAADYSDLKDSNLLIDSENEQIESSDDTDDREWMSKLTLNAKSGEIEKNQPNAELILENDPVFRGALAYDELGSRKKLLRSMPWRAVKTEDDKSWVDKVDAAGIRGYFQKVWNMNNDKDIESAVELVCYNHKYHPVREYLDSLVWDGTPRLDTVLIDYLGADDSAYTRAISRKWLTAAVKRIYHPGCKFDSCLVAYGKQGLGKSTFLQVLACDKWFNESTIQIGQKDGYQALRGNWLIEFAEFKDLRRSDLEAVKSFISNRSDDYRKAYGTDNCKYPRQCVFYATTNEVEFLKDATGERRFWPFEVTRMLDTTALAAARDQIWAEAVVSMRKGEQLWINPETAADVAEGWRAEIENHTQQDLLRSMIDEFLDKDIPEDYYELSVENRIAFMNGVLNIDAGVKLVPRNRISLTELRRECLQEQARDVGGKDATSMRLAGVMNNHPDWVRLPGKKKIRGYGTLVVYERKNIKVTNCNHGPDDFLN